MIDASTHALDISEARAFVEALTGSPDTVVLLVAIRPAIGDSPPHAETRRGSIPQLWKWVQTRQREGRGVFITVNNTDGMGRRKEDITRIRAVFIDNDTAAKTWRRDTPILPHLVVESSPGKFHMYWLTDAPSDLAFEKVMATAVAQQGADANATDISRVLRLPGTLHLKDPTHPHLVRVVHRDDRPRYTKAELFAAFPPSTSDDMDAGAPRFEPSAALDTIETGGVGLHDAFRGLAASLVSRGVPLDMTQRLMAGHAQHHSDGTSRYQERIAEIPQLVKTAATKFLQPENLDGKDPLDVFSRASMSITFDPAHYPAPIGDLASDIARRTGCDPLIPAWAALGVLSGLLPNSFALQVKAYDTEWRERSRLWIAFVGDPSTKKSPGIAAVLRAVERIESRSAGVHSREMARWADDCAAAKRDKLAPPPAPAMSRVMVNDATTEAIALVLNDNPAGVLSFQDELSGWFGAHDAYRASGVSKDRAFWLQAFNGQAYTVDRVKGAIHVPALSVALLGGIQPGPIRAVAAQSTDDGLLQRFITLPVSEACEGVDASPNVGAINAWAELVQQVVDLRQGSAWPETYRFDPAAQVVVDAARRRLAVITSSPAVEGRLLAALIKAEAQLARIILINHLVENRADADDLFGDSGQPTALVSKETATRGCAVFFDVVVPSTFDFYNRVIGASERQAQAQRVAGYILAKALESIADRDVYREALKELRDDERGRADVMRHLELAGWLQPVRELHGRTTRWHVNPRVHSKFAEQAVQEQARRKQVVESIRGGLK